MASALLQRKLLIILHRGLVECRQLAWSGAAAQVADLADMLEPIPSYMDQGAEGFLDVIRFNLDTYKRKYPRSQFDYLVYLDGDPEQGGF